jgi:hypothetical protein
MTNAGRRVRHRKRVRGSDMAQDHQVTFDWILYVILIPPVLFALWLLYKNRTDP